MVLASVEGLAFFSFLGIPERIQATLKPPEQLKDFPNSHISRIL